MTSVRPHPAGVKAVMCTLSPGGVGHPFFDSWDNLTRYDASHCAHTFEQGGTIKSQSGPRIHDTRNRLASTFLGMEGADVLLMIDSDMAFDDDALCKILGWMYDGAATARPDRPVHPIIGGLAFAGGKGLLYPTVYKPAPPESDSRMERWLDYPKDSFIQVAATGAAFLAVHRNVLEKMLGDYGELPDGNRNPYPWFHEGGTDNGHPIGEDIAFCYKAQASGFPIHVHTGIRTEHYKPVALDEAFYDSINAGLGVKLEVPT